MELYRKLRSTERRPRVRQQGSAVAQRAVFRARESSRLLANGHATVPPHAIALALRNTERATIPLDEGYSEVIFALIETELDWLIMPIP